MAAPRSTAVRNVDQTADEQASPIPVSSRPALPTPTRDVEENDERLPLYVCSVHHWLPHARNVQSPGAVF
jgi:hypothetical protein